MTRIKTQIPQIPQIEKDSIMMENKQNNQDSFTGFRVVKLKDWGFTQIDADKNADFPGFS